MSDKYYYGYAPEGEYTNTSDKVDGYSPTTTYTFTDKDGNTFSSLGDNGYVWQSVTEGKPIYVTPKGQWYTEPFLEVSGNNVTAYIPEWFKSTDEYNQWQTYASQIKNISLTNDNVTNLKDILSSLGKQGSFRESLRYDISQYGVKDRALQDKYVNDIVAIATEGQGKGAAKLNDIFGSNMDESAADVVRSFQKKGKEEMSKYMTWLQHTAQQGLNGTFQGTEKEMLDAMTLYRLLTYVDKNHATFGDNDEFNGLLEASTWQKLDAAGRSFMQTMMEGTIFGLPARLAYGIGESMHGRDFSLAIENGRSQLLSTTSAGAGLNGTEGLNSIANLGGTAANMAVTMATSMYIGSSINAAIATSSPGSFLAKVGTYMQTIPGAAVTDFFINDIPIDLTFFVTDWARTGDIGKAWYNDQESQPLFGIPVLGHFGPQAPNGLAMNLLGDATIDAALPVLSIATNTATKSLDKVTNGGVSRFKENVALKNLKLQEKLTDIPILGDAWKKFMNHMMGGIEAQAIREARKEAIAKGSMDPYIKAQNVLTLKNHEGMEVIAPLYKSLDDSLGVQDSIKNFQKNANSYGGTGETRVKYKDIDDAAVKNGYHIVPDQLPKEVKQGLLDYERLGELQGEKLNGGGLIPDEARDAEIATLEKKIAKLEKEHPEILEFARNFSDLNKGVEQIGVKLGVKNEEWVAALQMDPRWANYMTRQSLVPGFGSSGGTVDPRDAKIINASRKGYYADNYIDPTIALGLKVEALGRAYAWNELAKTVVASEVALGKVVAGKGSVETAKRLTEVKEQIRNNENYRRSIGYDVTVKSVDSDSNTIGQAFEKINDLLHLPEKISLKSIYNATQDKRILGIVDDFHTGKIQVDDDAVKAAGLSASDVANVIDNTYKYVGMKNKVGKNATIADVIIERNGLDTNTKIEEAFKEFWDANGDSTILASGAASSNRFGHLVNDKGELDLGVDGLTYKQRKQAKADADIEGARQIEEWSRRNETSYKKYEEEHTKWLDGMRDYVMSKYDNWTEAQKAKDPFAQKLYEEYEKKFPEPKYTFEALPETADVTFAKNEMDRLRLKGGDELVDNDAPLDFVIVANTTDADARADSNFNWLTRGEVRRDLYQKGYDKLDEKKKASVDKADSAFTQRLNSPVVLYRGEYGKGNMKGVKVGDKLDTSSWTYTQLYPEETGVYRHGITSGHPVRGLPYQYQLGEGILYRYHMKDGSPVFHKQGTHLGWGADSEFVLPRGVDATVTSIKKGFVEPFSPDTAGTSLTPATKKLKNGEGTYAYITHDSKTPRLKPVTIVDVEVDPKSGVTPSLDGTGRLESVAGGKIDSSTRATGSTYADEIAEMERDLRLYELASRGTRYSIGGGGAEYSPVARTIMEKYGFDTTSGGLVSPVTVKDKIQKRIDALKSLDAADYGTGRLESVAGGTIDASEVTYNVPDNVAPKSKKGEQVANVNAGTTADGRIFEYRIIDNKITDIKQVTDLEGMAEAINHLGGVYHITPETIDRMGMSNATAIVRTVVYCRDNMPNLPTGPTYRVAVGSSPNVLGWIPTPGALSNQAEYGFKNVNGKLEANVMPVYLGAKFYSKGNEDIRDRADRQGAASGFHPKNSTFPEATAVHETGHNIMARLVVLEINSKIDAGELVLPTDTWEINHLVHEHWEELHTRLAKGAFESLGIDFSEAEWRRQAKTISGYAASYDVYHYETFSEALLDYKANGANSGKFTIAIVEQMRKESQKYAPAVEPGRIFKNNGLPEAKGLFKNGQYAFPSTARSGKARGEWLNEWRQKNPFLNKKFTEENYQKANLWDTYFQKEIYSYDAKSKSEMPAMLAKKNGEFLENLADNSAKAMVDEIKKASIEGFSEDIAIMAFAKKGDDIAQAMETFIIQRVNKAAQEIAEKMPGGATAENLNRARLTMWSEDMVQNSMVNMVSRLAPDVGVKNIQDTIRKLFEDQAKGFASVEALPVETKNLIAQKERYQAEIAKNNQYAKKVGGQKEAKLAEEGYINNATQTIHYMEGGEDVYVVVSDPVVAAIMKKPNNYKETGLVVEALAQSANFISRLYRMGTTSLNPIAFVRNVLRDPLQATVQGGFNPLNMSLSPEVFYHTLRQFGLDDVTIKNVSERLKTWASAGTLTEELRRVGLNTPNSVGYRNGVEKVSKTVNNALKEGKLGKAINIAEAPLEAWESMFRNQIAQQSFVKNFERSRNVDSAMARALFDASNSTTNFSHSVGLFKRATATVPYLSSAINGTRSFWVQFNIDPISMVSRVTAGFMVPVMAITAWNLSDDERKKAYMNLPEWYRSSHLVLMDIDGNVFSLPIPDEIKNYFNVARQTMELSENVTPYSMQTIMLNGAFGFLPTNTDGFYGDDGRFNLNRGLTQMASGLLPQAVTTAYEWIAERDLFTGEDLSNYDGFNKFLNGLSNVFGTGIKSAINSIGLLCGSSEKTLVGKSFANTLARDLFGMGFDNAKTQFMNMIGSPSKVDADTGKKTAATGLFAESEELADRIEAIDKKIAVTTGEEKSNYEKQKQELIDGFTNKVSGLVNNYMSLFSTTGGLEDWQKDKIVSILMLGKSFSSAFSDSYQYADSSDAYLNERALAQQRYLNAGLPGGPSLETLGQTEEGSYLNSIELQAAINKFYGVAKQATQDYKNALDNTGLKNIRNEFYDAIQQIYDAADAQNKQPDYDLIEKIQARYLQAVDNVLIPLINQYGINILNNNDFLDAVRRQVNGMIPSDDWRQSAKNAKKFLSTKEFPTATVDVKKWLKQRYSSGLKDRGIDSDAEVVNQLKSIKKDIDNGNKGAAKGKIESLRNGINKANYYISAKDYQTLNDYYNMVK